MAKDTVLTIKGDASGAIRALNQVTQTAQQAQTRLQRMQKQFQQYLLKTGIANSGLKDRSIANARAEQLAAFERSHKFLTAQTQELYRQKYLNEQIAKSDTASWRQKVQARKELLALEGKIARAQQQNKKWANQYTNAKKSWGRGQYYAGPISSPADFAKPSFVEKFSPKNAYKGAFNSFGAGQNAIMGAMGTAAMASGAVYSFMRFVEPGGDVAQLVKNIKAVTGGDVKDLAEEVKRLGRTTPYTTRQVAQAAYTMSKAGYNAKEIREAISGSVYMGLATDTDPDQAADITAQTLSHFGLKTNMARRVTNLYAKAMVSSPAGLTDLAYTMQYAAPMAMLAKSDFSTTLAMTGILAKNGLKGSKAGTGIRSIFSSLAAPKGKAAPASLAALGVQTKDMYGNLRPIPKILADLNKGLAKLPTAAKTAHLKNIFGQVGMGAASILIEKSGKDNELVKYIQELRDADKQNLAAVIAKQKQDSFQGDIYSLSSAWEGIRIAVFDAVESKLRENIQSLTELALKSTNWINENEKTVQQWYDIGKYIVGAIGASAALNAAWGMLAYAAGGIQLVWAGIAGLAHGVYVSALWLGGALVTAVSPAVAVAAIIAAIPLSIYYSIKYADQLCEMWDTIGESVGLLLETIYRAVAPQWMEDLLDVYKRTQLTKERTTYGKDRDGAANKYSLAGFRPEEEKAVYHRGALELLALQNGVDTSFVGNNPMATSYLEKLLVDNGIVPNSGNWRYQKAYAAVKARYEKANGGALNYEEYRLKRESPKFYDYQQRKEAWAQRRADVEKEYGVKYGTAQLRDLTAAGLAARAANGAEALSGQQEANLTQAIQGLTAAIGGGSGGAGAGASAGGGGIPTNAGAGTAASAIPAFSPELMQQLAASAKPAQTTVTVGGTSVNVSVHCDASSIQTFVNQVVEAAKPQIEAFITAQTAKVKTALGSVGGAKPATSASIL